jgi:hypothetical protein
MRFRVLTERERKILEAYVQQDLKLDGFSVVSLRLKKAGPTVGADLKLMEQALKKINEHDVKGRPKALKERLKTVLPEPLSAQKDEKNR